MPDAGDEALRDLVRAREDAVVVGTQAKYRLKAFLLRQGRRYPGREGWTLPYRRWLTDLSFPDAAQHVALQEYRNAIDETEARITRLSEQLRQLVPTWRWAPVVAALQALRGISFVTACALVAELGDLRRFGHPRELMAYLGLVPSEHSSGSSVRRGGSPRRATRTCGACSPKPHGPIRARPGSGASTATDKKGCRFKRLVARGKAKPKVATAIARELAGSAHLTGDSHINGQASAAARSRSRAVGCMPCRAFGCIQPSSRTVASFCSLNRMMSS